MAAASPLLRSCAVSLRNDQTAAASGESPSGIWPDGASRRINASYSSRKRVISSNAGGISSRALLTHSGAEIRAASSFVSGLLRVRSLGRDEREVGGWEP